MPFVPVTVNNAASLNSLQHFLQVQGLPASDLSREDRYLIVRDEVGSTRMSSERHALKQPIVWFCIFER